MTPSPAAHRLPRIARMGQGAVLLALGILLSVLGYAFWRLITDPAASWAALAQTLDIDDIIGPLEMWRLWLMAIFWSLTDILGAVMLWTALGLFALFARGEVFVQETVRRLGHIGWCLVLIAPASILGRAACVMIGTFSTGADNHRISLGIEDTDVYAVVVGLLIIAASLAMSDALRLARENESFV